MLFRSGKFCVNFVAAFVATFAVLVIVQSITGLPASTALLVILPPIIAAMREGQLFARQYHRRPSVNLCWLASLRMTAMIVLIVLAVVLPQLVFQPQKLEELAEVDTVGRALAFLFMVAATWMLLRAGYAIGLATQLKGQQFSDDG